MNIAIFADLHGRILLAFKLCARWQRETGEKIDLILQAGDLGAFPEMSRLDRATRRYAEQDPTELGFMQHFTEHEAKVAAILAETTCPMIFVRGNHEDHDWLDELERSSSGPIFPVDVYHRVFNLKTGLPLTFHHEDEQITLLGIGRVNHPLGDEDARESKYIQKYEYKRIYALEKTHIDVLLTHDARPDFVLRESGVKTKAVNGMEEIGYILDRDRPAYHFFGHYGGPAQARPDQNETTFSVKLSDLHWERGGSILNDGSMGLLRWHSPTEHAFTLLDYSWLKEYTFYTWDRL